jgi:regulator of replication initiation timing
MSNFDYFKKLNERIVKLADAYNMESDYKSKLDTLSRENTMLQMKVRELEERLMNKQED